MRNTLLSILIVCAAFFSGQPFLGAQVVSDALKPHPNAVEETDTGTVYFSFSNTNFLKNNEYFWKIAIGYTYFGSQLNPQIAWCPNKYLRLQGGVYFRRDFGTTALQDLQATYSLKLQKNDISLTMGTLEGHVNHRLIEPLFNYERAITNPIENGIQLKIKKHRVWLDTWINWEQQEYFGSPFQEHICAGHSSRISWYENGRFRVVIPVQAIVFHKGGQIDTDTTDILSLTNSSTGLCFEYEFGDDNMISSENYYVYYKDISPAKHQQYISGDGIYLNLGIKTKYHVNLMASYWQGKFYMAPRGGFLYSSVSTIPGSIYTEDERKLVLLRLMFQREVLPGLYADIRYEPYFDLGNRFFDEFSYSVYLSYRKDFQLAKVKPKKAD